MAKSKRQFGIGALLFATFCIAGILAGYRFGGATKDAEVASSIVSDVNYDCRELLELNTPAKIDFELSEICALIVKTIEPDSWKHQGRSIHPYPANLSIVVRNTAASHKAIAELLESLRKLKHRTEPKR